MKKVLIIEDDPLMLRMYKKAFKFEGFKVEFAENGSDGLKKARAGNPGMIFLDVMMPEMSGLDVLEQLKGNKDTKDIPVVMLTNLVGSEDVEKAMSLGALKYIIKSEYDPKEVVDIALEVLGQSLKGEKKDE